MIIFLHFPHLLSVQKQKMHQSLPLKKIYCPLLIFLFMHLIYFIQALRTCLKASQKLLILSKYLVYFQDCYYSRNIREQLGSAFTPSSSVHTYDAVWAILNPVFNMPLRLLYLILSYIILSWEDHWSRSQRIQLECWIFHFLNVRLVGHFISLSLSSPVDMNEFSNAFKFFRLLSYGSTIKTSQILEVSE